MITTQRESPKTPKHHLFLDKLLSTVKCNDPTQPPPLTPTGLRAQLNHLRPRQAYFHVKVQIHQISIDSVPLMRGRVWRELEVQGRAYSSWDEAWAGFSGDREVALAGWEAAVRF